MNNFTYKSHSIRRNYGQHFLIDQLIIDNIISIINPKRDQAIVEIGPGLAALTKPVSEYVDNFTVIEIDKDLALRLKNNHVISSKLTVYKNSVMNINFNKLAKKMGQSLRIFGNLPYNISTSIIFHLFKYINVINDMHLMFQKEVANRLIAQPNSKLYGRLSIISQYYCKIIPVLEILPKSFIPSPKINSILLKFIPHTKLPYPVKDLHVLEFLTFKSFNQRRKIIINNLSNLIDTNELISLGINKNMRAENLSIDQYCQIANLITKNMITKK